MAMDGSEPYAYPKLPSYPFPASRPPLSALDKFLLSEADPSRQGPGQDGPGEVSAFSVSGSGHAGGAHQEASSSSWLLPVLQDQPNCNYFNFDVHRVGGGGGGGLFQGGFIDFDQDSGHHQIFMSAAGLDLANSKRGKGPSDFLIKGQWTEEEDSALIELVEELGYRKWAQIAENLLGRTGKQCRERWQNHLRPDIKKDSWTEDEERLLVEAHQLFGNKWAEIAKKIPGRTENSIKNHWNATKRRQNSRRKIKKMDGKSSKQKSCVLQEYIKRICENDNPVEDPYDIDDSSPLLNNGCDDEILFMQNFFKDFNVNPNVPEVVVYDDQVSFSANKPDNNYQLANESEKKVLNSWYENSNDLTQDCMGVGHSTNASMSGPLYSDLYISKLLEGVGYNIGSDSSLFSFNDEYNYSYDEIENADMELEDHISYQESKDMDLMEMVYGATLDSNGEANTNQFVVPFCG